MRWEMRHSWGSRRGLVALATGAVLVAGLAACGDDDSGADGGKTLVFGGSADPKVIDGAYVSDGESSRVVTQIFEGLVTTKPGGTDVVPQLAEKWEASPDGLAWTFNLRQGVKFHDGEPFNADAVCYNFDRWYNFKGAQQSPDVSYYWQTVFGGFATKDLESSPDESLYKSCDAKDDATVTINLTKPSSSFLSGLTLPAFSFASPKALEEYGDDVVMSGDSVEFKGGFGNEHPTGTGPFKFDSWQRGEKLTLSRNDDYWGDKTKLDTLIFRPIADGPARKQALQSGEIDGYDLVDPADVDSLKSDGFQMLERPAFNVGYVGFNQKKKPLDNKKIRQAIAYALNREGLLQAKYPAGAEVATQFQPPELWGWNPDVPKYDYDPEKAKQLIAESGVKNPTLEFWYPTGVSRPYMPDPAANFQAFKADLEKVGFKVVTKSAPWTPDYTNATDNGKAAMYLLGWTGDFGDPDNFLGTFFQGERPAFGFNDPKLFKMLDDAESETDQAKREQMYKDANAYIMEEVPGVPYVHTKPNIAFKKGITGYEPSPVNNESFASVDITG